MYVRRRRVPLPEIYSSISEAFRVAYANKTEVPGVEVMSGVEGDCIAALPGDSPFARESADFPNYRGREGLQPNPTEC